MKILIIFLNNSASSNNSVSALFAPQDGRIMHYVESAKAIFQSVQKILSKPNITQAGNYKVGNLGSLFLVCRFILTQLDKLWKTT